MPVAADDWASAEVQSGLSWSDATIIDTTGSFAFWNATIEAGEPQPSCSPGQTHTYWYAWTCPTGLSLPVDSCRVWSEGSSHPVVLAVYTGASLAGLAEVACDNLGNVGGFSDLSFVPTPGTTYFIQVSVPGSVSVGFDYARLLLSLQDPASLGGIQVEVYTDEVSGTPQNNAGWLATLTEDFGRSCRIAKNDAGTWTFSVLRDSSEAALVQTNRWVKFRLGGEVIQSGRIAPWEQDTISQAEESGEALVVNAGGTLATLRDATVWPAYNTGRLARDTRFFNFASTELDRSAWTAAVQLYQQGDPSTSLYGIKNPKDWPDKSAWWIWGTPINLSASPPMAVGDCYFWNEIYLPNEGDFAFFITADDGYELWIDGVQQLAQTEAFIWKTTFRLDLFLDAGYHEIAIKATNIDRPSTVSSNAAGLLFAMYSTSGGELLVLQLHSDNTWLCSAYPAQPPGFTAGAILDTLMSEAQGRGALLPWSWSFTWFLDSNGNAWADEIEISFRYEDTVGDVLAKLGEKFIDYGADAGRIELDAVNKGGYGAATGVALAEGTNLTNLHHSNDPSKVTDLLAKDSEGHLSEVNSGLAGGTQPRIESFLEGGTAGSPASMQVMADGVFDNAGAKRVAVTAGVLPVAGATPLVDFFVGQSVTAPDRALAGAATEVNALVITDRSETDDGEPTGSVDYAMEGWQVA